MDPKRYLEEIEHGIKFLEINIDKEAYGGNRIEDLVRAQCVLLGEIQAYEKLTGDSLYEYKSRIKTTQHSLINALGEDYQLNLKKTLPWLYI